MPRRPARHLLPTALALVLAIPPVSAQTPTRVAAPAPTAPADPAARAPAARVVGNVRISSMNASQQIRLEIGKTIVIELPEDAKDIVVSNPQVANAVVRSARRIFLIGTGVGSSNLIFFDGAGNRIASIDVVVERDLEGLNRTLRRLFPATNVRAEGIGENVILSGQVNSAAEARMAVEVAERFVGQLGSNGQTSSTGGAGMGAPGGGAQAAAGVTTGAGTVSSGGSRIVNALTIAGRDQVHLRVVVAEMDRRAIQQIGVNLQGNWRIGGNGIQFNQNNPYPVNTPSTSTGTLPGSFGSPTATPPFPIGVGSNGLVGSGFVTGELATQVDVRAFEQTGLIRTLAEPTLTAISGENASFLAGGEFPVPVARDRDGNITIEYKQFGVALSFIPVVLSEGRISVQLRTEVSELDPSAGYTSGGFTIPGLAVRRAQSTLELPSGGTLVLAGLIRDQTRRSVSGVPGLRRLPILGRLFSSQDYQQNQSELVVLVTPYIVNPVARRELALPTDGFVNASDPEALIYNRINSVYGRRANPPAQRPQSRFGYIYE
jgi:pilus assembly protein CpaC